MVWCILDGVTILWWKRGGCIGGWSEDDLDRANAVKRIERRYILAESKYVYESISQDWIENNAGMNNTMKHGRVYAFKKTKK